MAARLGIGLLATAGIVLLGGLHGPVARGQDDWNVANKAVYQPIQDDVMALPEFDQWVLGGKTHDQIEGQLKSQFALQVAAVDRACQLSIAQREKLQLAGEGDMIRLYRTIDRFRQRFHEVGQNQQKINELEGEASVLQMKMQTGVFDDWPLFQKVLRQTLSGEQSARYDQQERERRKFRYEAKIELVVSQLENSYALCADQQQRLVKLLVDDTEPPKKFGQYDFYVFLFQLSRLEEAKLKLILDDSQRQSLQKALDGYRGLEPFLKSQGYLP